MYKGANENILNRVAMLLSNPFRPDPRVLKEATSLQEAGYQVTILCWDRKVEMPPFEDLDSGVRIVRIQNVPSSYGIGNRQLLRIPYFWYAVLLKLNELKPDLIHCHDFDTFPIGLMWAKLHRIPVLYDAHEYYADLCKPRLQGFIGNILYSVIKFTELFCSRFASAVITVDNHLGEIYRRQNRKVKIIGHYPSLSLAAYHAPVFTRKNIRLVYIGRISRDRGIYLYVDILRALLKSGIKSKLILAGVFTPANEEEYLRKYIGGVETNIDFIGWLPYDLVPELLRNCDIGLAILQPIPRYIKALPVKLFEYMAVGLPVIISNFPQNSQVISENDCGILVNPLDSPGYIAEQIINWSQNPSIPIQLGRNGQRAITEQYNWENLMEELKTLYTELQNNIASPYN